MRAILFLILAAAAAGCTDTGDAFPLNDAAKRLGPMQFSFVRTGVGSGPVTITMADGEVLYGRYRVAFGGGETFAFSGHSTATAIAVTGGPVRIIATGPKTQMLCRGSSSGGGHGGGQCQTYEGALWAVSW
jgi:hypothetical protein